MIGLYSNQPSLHKNYREGSRLRAKQDLAEGDIAHIPLEVVLDAGSYNDQTDRNAGSHTAYTSIESVDAASIPVESIERELDRLSLIDKAEFSFRIPKELLGHVSTDADADDPAKMSRALQDLYEIRRHGQTTASSASQVTATETAHRFACDQVAVDLALSREVMFSRAPTLIQEGSSDLAMTSYDRLADVPDIEYGYFKPVDAHGNTPSSDAARALLSEWTLGANPSVRPPFVNPYGQQIKDQKEANTQLKAFKTRIATGLGVSASQPMPGVSRPLSSRPAMAGLSEFSRLGKENDSQVLREDRTASASQNQPEMQIASSTQAETQSVPFTQMLPGVHGGRPAVKKKKKRTGGF